MIICLDYDGTYTHIKHMLDAIIEMSTDNFKVVLCTMRHEYEKTEQLKMLENMIPVYYSGRKAKKPFLESLGLHVQVWIDDRPDFILNDSV